MFLLIYISVFALTMMKIQSQNVCDCNEINLLKGIVQKIAWDQNVESAKLAKLEAWRMSNPVSSGIENNDFVERLENMEKKVFDIDKKLEKLVEKEDHGDRENIDVIFRKGITSVKLERLDFMKDVKSQIGYMKDRIGEFKSEFNKTIGKVITDTNKSGEDLKNEIDVRLTKVKDETERFTDAIVMNITHEINENMEHLTHFNKSLYEATRNIKAIERIAVIEKVDGKWSDWSKWSNCSVSCGSGNKYRERSCSSPPPSELGKQCQGNSRQTDSCDQEKCREQQVAFHAYGIAAGSTDADRPTFPKLITNIGNDYNIASGIFTCEVPGIYHFGVTLSIRYGAKSSTQSKLKINSRNVLDIFVNPRDKESYNMYPASASGIFRLSKGDKVYIGESDEVSIFFNDLSTNFFGVLVAAEN